MYLLEAKKKAEKEIRREEAAERRRKKKEDIKEEQKRQQERLKQAEERQVQEALRRSQEEAEAAERRRRREQEQIQQAMAASASGHHSPALSASTSGQRGSPQVIRSAPLQAERKFESFGRADDEWHDVQAPCMYVGTFEVGKGKLDKAAIKSGIRSMKQFEANGRRAILDISLQGIKVVDGSTNRVAMAHALQRVSMCSVDTGTRHFGFVAKNPGVLDKFCHVFAFAEARQAQDIHAVVGKAFKKSFANKKSQKETKANPDWSKSMPKSQPGSSASAAQAKPAEKPPVNPVSPPASASPKRHVLPRKSPPSSPSSKHPSRQPSGASINVSLDNAAWYQQGLSRELCVEILTLSEDGAFIVRDSQSQPGCFALTMKAEGQIHNYIIRLTKQGYIIGSHEDGERPFATLAELIAYHGEHKGILPQTLSLEQENVMFSEKDDEEQGAQTSYVDPEYQSIRDLVQGLRL